MRGCGTLVAARAPLMALVISLGSPAIALPATKHAANSAQHPFAYDTAGIVGIGADPASVSGPDFLRFNGLTNASYDPRVPGTINLGQFAVVPSSIVPGTTTTYTDTPFQVEIQAPEFNKTSTVPLLDKLFPTFGKDLHLKTVMENSLLLTGHLDGTIGPNGQVNVTATVTSIKLGSLNAPTQDNVTHYTFPIRFSQLMLPAPFVLSSSVSSLTVSPSAMATAPTTTPNPAAEVLIPALSATTIAPAPAAEVMITATPTPTPEPSTVVLFAVTFGGLILGRKRLQSR